MKTIYDKLNPEIKESIKKDLERYPVSIGELISKLQNSNFWSELSVGEVQSLITHSHSSFYELSMKDLLWGDKFLIEC